MSSVKGAAVSTASIVVTSCSPPSLRGRIGGAPEPNVPFRQSGIAWIFAPVRATVAELLHIPAGWRVRTVVAIGHPSPEARRPKSAPGTARLPRDEVVFHERWPAD
jgi:hypothetical protein